MSLHVLDEADAILLLLSPEMASIRAAGAALETYRALNYPEERVRLVLNNTFPKHGIAREKIEEALGSPLVIGIPYTPEKFVQAINVGQPLVLGDPGDQAVCLFEDFAFYLSKETHKKSQPDNASPSLKRVYRRYAERKRKS